MPEIDIEWANEQVELLTDLLSEIKCNDAQKELLGRDNLCKVKPYGNPVRGLIISFGSDTYRYTYDFYDAKINCWILGEFHNFSIETENFPNRDHIFHREGKFETLEDTFVKLQELIQEYSNINTEVVQNVLDYNKKKAKKDYDEKHNMFHTSTPWHNVTAEEEAQYNADCIEFEHGDIIEGAGDAVFLGSANHSGYDGGPEYLYWELNGQVYRTVTKHSAWDGTSD